MTPRKPVDRITLIFEHHDVLGLAGPLRADLSAVVRTGRTLWVASDEATSVERLTEAQGGGYGAHVSCPLIKALDLPDKKHAREIDMEGLWSDGGRLWLVGSHARRRRRPHPERHDQNKMLKRLSEPVDAQRDRNRFVLGCVPLRDGGDGLFDLDLDGGRRLPMRDRGTGGALTDLIHKDDRTLRRFLALPGKENGFDVEGLAVRGRRAFVGLRGPVLAGYAVLLGLRLDDAGRDRLELGAWGDEGERVIKTFADLQGLGVRDLAFGPADELLILAGPTMDADGPCYVFRWAGALAEGGADAVIHAGNGLECLMRVPAGPRPLDRPEGLEVLDAGAGGTHVLIVHDNPAPRRLVGETGVFADIYRI